MILSCLALFILGIYIVVKLFVDSPNDCFMYHDNDGQITPYEFNDFADDSNDSENNPNNQNNDVNVVTNSTTQNADVATKPSINPSDSQVSEVSKASEASKVSGPIGSAIVEETSERRESFEETVMVSSSDVETLNQDNDSSLNNKEDAPNTISTSETTETTPSAQNPPQPSDSVVSSSWFPF